MEAGYFTYQNLGNFIGFIGAVVTILWFSKFVYKNGKS